MGLSKPYYRIVRPKAYIVNFQRFCRIIKLFENQGHWTTLGPGPGNKE